MFLCHIFRLKMFYRFYINYKWTLFSAIIQRDENYNVKSWSTVQHASFICGCGGADPKSQCDAMTESFSLFLDILN